MNQDEVIALAEARLRLKSLPPDTDGPRDELGVIIMPDLTKSVACGTGRHRG
jgi:hypothetical protein